MSEGTIHMPAGAGHGQCVVCGCDDFNACPGGCVWANAQATLCSRCVLDDGAGTDEEGPTHADNLDAALRLGGFSGGVLPTLAPGAVDYMLDDSDD